MKVFRLLLSEQYAMTWCGQYTYIVLSIVAVHGLDGDREHSWTSDNGICWLRDLLPKVVPQARILTYGYDAYTRGRIESSANQSLFDVAGDLVSKLVAFRLRSGSTVL